MVDRRDRNELIALIDSYLHEKITAFQFDEGIFGIADRTEDDTVNWAILSLWYCYDDCKDHRVVASREWWDFFQRLLLLLASDGEVEETRQRKWTTRQVVAAACLAFFGLAAGAFGIGYELAFVCIPLGLVSVALCYRQWVSDAAYWQRTAGLMPFSSLAELRGVREAVWDFSKKRYPPHLATRRIRSPLMEKLMYIEWCIALGAAWLAFVPLLLLLQTLPKAEVTTKVHMC